MGISNGQWVAVVKARCKEAGEERGGEGGGERRKKRERGTWRKERGGGRRGRVGREGDVRERQRQREEERSTQGRRDKFLNWESQFTCLDKERAAKRAVGFTFPKGIVQAFWAVVGPCCSLLVLTALVPIYHLRRDGAPEGRGALGQPVPGKKPALDVVLGMGLLT